MNPEQKQTAAQRKTAEAWRHREAGRMAVTVWVYPATRPNLARYIKRLNERYEARPDYLK